MNLAIAKPQLFVTANDNKLTSRILAKVKALGLGLADEFKTQMKLLVKAVIDITPPSGGKKARGRIGLETGKAAIRRDEFFMGFVPVEIKGHRTITQAFGRPIVPVTVKTKPNPKFADPNAFHEQRLRSRFVSRRARVSRGRGGQAFYADRTQFTSMQNRLYKEIGKLAAAWIGIARRLNDGQTPTWIPAWVRRHEAWGLAHTTVEANLDPAGDRLSFVALNHCPSTVDNDLVTDTQRRVELAKGYRADAVKRGLKGRAQRIAQAS